MNLSSGEDAAAHPMPENVFEMVTPEETDARINRKDIEMAALETELEESWIRSKAATSSAISERLTEIARPPNPTSPAESFSSWRHAG